MSFIIIWHVLQVSDDRVEKRKREFWKGELQACFEWQTTEKLSLFYCHHPFAARVAGLAQGAKML